MTPLSQTVKTSIDAARKNVKDFMKATIKTPKKSNAIHAIDQLANYSASKNTQHLHTNLPYRFYDEDTQVFHNINSIGFGQELSVLSGASEDLVKSLHNLIMHKLPEGKKWDFNFVMTGDNKVAPQIRKNLIHHSVRPGIYTDMNIRGAKFAETAACQGLPTNYGSEYHLDLKNYRSFLFCTTKEDTKKLETVREQILMDLSQNEVGWRHLSAKDLIEHVQEIINHDITSNVPKKIYYNEHEYLNRQMLSPDTTIAIEEETAEKIDASFGVKHNDRYTKRNTRMVTLGLRGLPQAFSLNQFPNCIANMMNMVQSIKCPFRLSMNFHMEPLAESKLSIAKSFRSKDKWLKSPARFFMSGIEQEVAEHKQLNEHLSAKGGIKLGYFTLHVTLFTTKEKYQSDIAAVQSSFSVNAVELFPLQFGNHTNAFLATLPFNMLPLMPTLNKMGSFFRVKSSNIVNFLPLVADWKAAPQGLLLPTFRNQVAFFDNFNFGTDNYNIAVTATSGAGKSFLVQAMVFSILSSGGQAYVIDVGGSYKKLCQFLNGAYLDHTHIRLNPFTHVKNIKSVFGNIGELILQMASPNDEVSDFVRKATYKAVLMAFQSQGNQATIDDVQLAIRQLAKARSNDDRLLDIADNLDIYTTTGELGELFNEPSQLDPNQPFTCLELEGFDEDVLQPVLFALMVTVNQQMYLSGKKRKKICVIEEAWSLLEGTNKAAQTFIKKGYRTARKFNGSFCAVTQRINDFFSNSTAEAAYGNSDIKLILRQNAKYFKKFVETEAYKGFFDAYEKTMIENFPTAKEAGFSSIMIQAGKSASFHRLFVDPFMKVLFTTNPDEQSLIDALLAQNVSLSDAIYQVAKKLYPDELKMIGEVA